ncbi:MAG: type II toxin-antitoxin system Phd/YefM family antitoxin [Acidobacteriota bacterium]|nr:type II toxin-antitoxin system Phd/YefM family antitoxin [Acidobacteriota bacterium]
MKTFVTIPLAEVSQDLEAVVRRVQQADSPAVLTREGHAEAVLLAFDAFERAQAERALLLRLARGEQEIAGGEGVDLDQLLAEADSILGHPATGRFALPPGARAEFLAILEFNRCRARAAVRRPAHRWHAL